MKRSLRAARAGFIALLGAALLGVSAPATAAVPPTPTITTVEILGDAAHTLAVTWNHVGTAVNSYEIHYRPTGTTAWQWSGTSAVGADHGSWVPYIAGQNAYTREFRIPNAAPNTSYDIGLKALGTDNAATIITNADVVTVATTPPLGAVTAVASGAGEVKVTWPKYSAKPFLQYDLYLGEGTGVPTWAKHSGDQGATSHIFTGLKAGATYTVGVRVTQSSDRSTGSTLKWVRTGMQTASVQTGGELFTSTVADAFVSTATGKPVVINGVNLKKGPWNGGNPTTEIAALATKGSPDFNAVRIVMDWPYFQQATKQANGTWGPATLNESAFAQLDELIAVAKDAGLYVILDPIHAVTQTAGACVKGSPMEGATYGLPRWAWSRVKVDTNDNCAQSSAVNDVRPELDKMDDVLIQPDTVAYLSSVLKRYDATTQTDPTRLALAQQVIAVDLVNEPHSSDEAGRAQGLKANSSPSRMQQLVKEVYTPWLGTGAGSVRNSAPGKILILEPIGGASSLAGVNFGAMDTTNVVLSLHDYFAKSTGTDEVMGFGYSKFGNVAIENTDNWKSPDAAYVGNHAARKAEHSRFVKQFQDWSAAAGMPIYIGEYGIVNACTKGAQGDVNQYAKDTFEIYRDLRLSRTHWTHGSGDAMAIWWQGNAACGTTTKGNYLPHAFELTGGARR